MDIASRWRAWTHPDAAGARRSQQKPANGSCSWPGRIRTGDTGASRANSLDELLGIRLDPVVTDGQVGLLLRSRVGMKRLRAVWATRRERLPRDHGHLAMTDASVTATPCE